MSDRKPAPRGPLGYIRVDEEFLPVTSIELAVGGFLIRAEAPGPLPAMAGHLRLFTPDNKPVTEWARGETTRVDIPATKASGAVKITWSITLDAIESRGSKVRTT